MEAREQSKVLANELRQRNPQELDRVWGEWLRSPDWQANPLQPPGDFPIERLLRRINAALAESDDGVDRPLPEATTRVLKRLNTEAIRAGFRQAGDTSRRRRSL